MNIAEIKRLATTFSNEELRRGEAQLVENIPLRIDIAGDTNAQKLTHLLAALAIQQSIEIEKKTLTEAVRLFAKRVRNSTIR